MGFKAMNLVSCCCCLVILGTPLHATTSANNPGMKLRLSAKGLGYAADIVADFMAGKVLETKIPDQSGKVKTLVGNIDYGLSAIKIQRFSCSSKSVTVNPGAGLTLTLSDLDIALQGNWRYSYKLFLKTIKDQGTFEGSISQSAIDVSVTLGMDSLSQGRPTIRSISCESRLDAIDFKLDGGASWLYNVFVWQFDGTIRKLLEDVVCQSARKVVDEDVESILSSLQVVVPVRVEWRLDLGLVEAPRFQPGSVEFPLKGQFVHQDDVGVASPYTADPYQLIGSSQMASGGISQYTLQTAGYALFRRGIFRHNLTSVDLPVSEQNFLRTTGGTFGSLVPAVASQYPDATVELEMTATSPPDMLIGVNGVRSIVSFSVKFRARMSDGSLFYLLTADVSATVGVSVTIDEFRLRGNLTGFVPTIAVTDSVVGTVEDNAMQTVLNFAARVFIVPRLNEALQQGASVQKFGDFRLANQGLETLSQFLQINTDVIYGSESK